MNSSSRINESQSSLFPEINNSYKRGGTNDIGMPVKKLLKDQRMNMITSNPQNVMGTAYLRDKFKLPDPNKGKTIGRQIGGASSNLNSKPVGKITKPKRILPKYIRDDPLADGPKITEDDLRDGMMSLLNRGIIPKGVDVTPAFERGDKPFGSTTAKIHTKSDRNIKLKTPSLIYKDHRAEQNAKGPTTFITAEDGFENNYMNDIHKSNDNLFTQNHAKAEEKYEGGKGQRDILQTNQADEYDLPPAHEESQLEVKEKEEDFGYSTQENQVNDSEKFYSMYQIIIKGGTIVENTPEFISFKRTNITKWGAISLVLYLLEKMLTLYHIPHAIVDCQKLIILAEDELTRPNYEELLTCLINKSQVEEHIRNPVKKFKGPSGPDLAAICIQKNWRRFKAYTSFTLLKYSMSKATIIQRRWRLFQLMKNTKAKIKQFNEESINEWKIMMKEFRRRWPEVKKKRRVEIHINSFSFSEAKRLSMEKFQQRENCQISRIFSVKDPKVDVIYISPFTLTNEVYEYYKKILELGELEKPENRFHIVVPENYVKFKETMSLTQTLLYSPKAIKRIKSLIQERQAYIVPGISTKQDIKLSITLGIPIMCGDPSKISMYSTKSGAKRIFQQADVPSPISAYDIYDK